jgi:zinc transport system substrate-binding protein
VTSHNAFGYLAQRYGLTQIGITGLTPDAEPTAARLAEVAQLARREKVKVIFFETLVSPKIAETLASEVGARAEKLDPIEGLKAGNHADYISVMRSNLATLHTALGCS